MIEVGDSAPEFTLDGAHQDEIGQFTLSDAITDKLGVLVFYVHDFSPQCTEQMCEVNDSEMLTFEDEVTVLGISSDGPYSHREFGQQNRISYPLLSDVNLDVYDDYGLLDVDDGVPQPRRGVFLVDTDQTVRYRWKASDNTQWSMDPLQDVYELIQEFKAT